MDSVEQRVSGQLAVAISQARLNTKLSAATDDPVQAWYPYYAGYSEEFARGIIKAAESVADPMRILDPWNGSGTTTRAGHSLGHYVTGFDINPVTLVIASAKLANPDDAKHVHGLALRFSNDATRVKSARSDPLRRWLPEAVVGKYRAIERQIIAELASDVTGHSIDPRHEVLPPLAAFLMLALIRAAKSLAAVKKSSNPTWQRPSGDIQRGWGKQLCELWTATLVGMAADLERTVHAVGRGQSSALALASSRKLPIVDGSIDLVVTSPPYCTRIDYFVGSAFELAALGISEDDIEYRQLRERAMGTNLSRSQDAATVPEAWPESVRTLLSSIRTHPSKASGTYYLKTYAQYFEDCLSSLKEIRRVLRIGGAAALVVQSSYYKDIYVDLPQLYVSCGRSLGLVGSVTSSLTVTKALAQINTNSRKHKDEKLYEESVVVFEKPASV